MNPLEFTKTIISSYGTYNNSYVCWNTVVYIDLFSLLSSLVLIPLKKLIRLTSCL